MKKEETLKQEVVWWTGLSIAVTVGIIFIANSSWGNHNFNTKGTVFLGTLFWIICMIWTPIRHQMEGKSNRWDE